MTDLPQANPEIDQELDELATVIRRAERDLVENKLLTIGGLPERTQAVCNRVAELPVEEGRQYEDRLNALIAELDALGRNISTQQQELVQRLAEMEEADTQAKGPDQT
jgi:hypothetical protein